jgi:site-specific recombinase
LLQLQASKLEKKLVRLREAYLDGIETMDSYKNAKQSLETELLELQEQIDQLDSKALEVQEEGDIKSSIQSVLAILGSAEGTNPQKHEAITSVIESCIFDKQKNLLEIQYRYLAPSS